MFFDAKNGTCYRFDYGATTGRRQRSLELSRHSPWVDATGEDGCGLWREDRKTVVDGSSKDALDGIGKTGDFAKGKRVITHHLLIRSHISPLWWRGIEWDRGRITDEYWKTWLLNCDWMRLGIVQKWDQNLDRIRTETEIRFFYF